MWFIVGFGLKRFITKKTEGLPPGSGTFQRKGELHISTQMSRSAQKPPRPQSAGAGEPRHSLPLGGRLPERFRWSLAKAGPGIRFNEHMEDDGETVFRHACKLGLEGIVSKRKDSVYRSGRSPDWLKMKNSDAPAVKRSEEDQCGKKTCR